MDLALHSRVVEEQLNSVPDSLSHSSIYKYESLAEKPDCIRVLCLHPDKEQLTCDIRAISLETKIKTKPKPKASSDSTSHQPGFSSNQTPSYIALSYEWGSLNKTCMMQVVSHDDSGFLGIIPITQSLHNALTDVRNSNLPKFVFADQVCIDQKDEEELNHQVTHMGKVYSSAEMVVVYLGPHQDGDVAGFELIDTIHNHFKLPWEEIMLSFERELSSFVKQRFKNYIFYLEDSHKGYESLKDMMWSGWSHRLWMAPEAMLNDNTCFLRGTRIISEWTKIVGLHALQKCRLLELKVTPGAKNSKMFNSALAVFRRKRQQNQLNLMVNLAAFADCNCSDARDKVYALLSISRDVERLGIKPDYSKDKRAVYKDIAMKHSQFHRNLRILKYAEIRDHFQVRSGSSTRKNKKAPWESWLPDWEAPERTMYLLDGSVWPHQKDLQASDFQFQHLDGLNRTACIVSGFLIDEVDDLSNSSQRFLKKDFRGANSGIPLEESRLSSFQTFVDTARSQGFSYDDIAGSLIPTSRDLVIDSSDKQLGVALLLYLKHQWNKTRRASKDHNSEQTLNDIEKSAHEETLAQVDIELADTFALAADQARNRKVIITQGGRLCLAHFATKPGDVIAVLFGGFTLTVLRPRSNGHYTFVGNAFIGDHDPKWFATPPYAIHSFSIV